MRQGRAVSTTTGTAEAGGDGGNIIFNGNFIVAVPQEDSNISANAFSGRGGNIRSFYFGYGSQSHLSHCY
jgi:large exoprotein involved in heme utilization and adhesion